MSRQIGQQNKRKNILADSHQQFESTKTLHRRMKIAINAAEIIRVSLDMTAAIAISVFAWWAYHNVISPSIPIWLPTLVTVAMGLLTILSISRATTISSLDLTKSSLDQPVAIPRQSTSYNTVLLLVSALLCFGWLNILFPDIFPGISPLPISLLIEATILVLGLSTLVNFAYHWNLKMMASVKRSKPIDVRPQEKVTTYFVGVNSADGLTTISHLGHARNYLPQNAVLVTNHQIVVLTVPLPGADWFLWRYNIGSIQSTFARGTIADTLKEMLNKLPLSDVINCHPLNYSIPLKDIASCKISWFGRLRIQLKNGQIHRLTFLKSKDRDQLMHLIAK